MSILLTCFYSILEKSIFGTCCILFILLFRFFLKRFPKVFSYCLWAVAGFRLLFSFSFQSIFSLIKIRPERILTSEIWDAPIIQTQNVEPIPSGNVVTMPIGDTIASVTTTNSGYATMGSSLSLSELLSLIWLMGFLVFVGGNLYKYLRFHLRLNRMELHKLSYGSFNIYEVQGFSQAFTMGILKPRIYLPQDMKEESRQLVILHECTHIKRKDFLFKPLGLLICCLHWFNPIVWLGFSLFCRDMEMSCDESVICRLDGDVLSCKKDYSNVLLSMAGSTPLNRIPLFFGEPGVRQRIKNVLAYKKRTVICSGILVIILLAAAFFLLANTGNAGNKGADIADNGTENESSTNFTNILVDTEEHEDYHDKLEQLENAREEFEIKEEELKRFQEEIQKQEELIKEEELKRLQEELQKQEEAIKEAEFQLLKKEYAVMMEQNKEWYDSIFSYSGDLSNPISGYIRDPQNYHNQIVVFNGQIEDLETAVVDEEVHISSAVLNGPYLIITFENGESLTIDSKASEYAPLHFDLSMKYTCTDLNLDGEKELIFMFDLGYAGGFGGCAILLYTHTPDGWKELAPPEGYDIESGFPMQFVWNGSKMFFTEDGSTDLGLGAFLSEDLAAIYEVHDFPMISKEETLTALSEWKDVSGRVDVPYTFSLYYEDGKPVLVTCEYVSGMYGHSDPFGNLVHEWRLLEDNTWDIRMFFLLMN
ncbi:MAG: M56 family metallopeptidase [Lachnospiraceae bacterium]|nr:M56 family metallopeptidase [Lachnospiraceae bacterium]